MGENSETPGQGVAKAPHTGKTQSLGLVSRCAQPESRSEARSLSKDGCAPYGNDLVRPIFLLKVWWSDFRTS